MISDEVYRTIVFNNGKHFSIAQALPDQTIVVGGASKEIAATGLRVGWVAGPQHIISCIGTAFSFRSIDFAFRTIGGIPINPFLQ